MVCLITVPALIPTEVKYKLPSKIKACYVSQESFDSMQQRIWERNWGCVSCRT